MKSAVPLGVFMGTTFLAITFMGGVYAILPAYEADLFGETRVMPAMPAGPDPVLVQVSRWRW